MLAAEQTLSVPHAFKAEVHREHAGGRRAPKGSGLNIPISNRSGLIYPKKRRNVVVYRLGRVLAHPHARNHASQFLHVYHLRLRGESSA